MFPAVPGAAAVLPADTEAGALPAKVEFYAGRDLEAFSKSKAHHSFPLVPKWAHVYTQSNLTLKSADVNLF